MRRVQFLLAPTTISSPREQPPHSQLDKNALAARYSPYGDCPGSYAPSPRFRIDRLPAEIVARVRAVVRAAREVADVSGVKALSGPLAGHWRLRTGDYRVQFRMEGNSVIVEKVGHRR